MEAKITVKGIYWKKNRTFPDLNDYVSACRTHWSKGASMVKDYKTVSSVYIRKCAGRQKFAGQVEISYRYYEADEKRDISNVSAFFRKVFEDALQQCGTIVNDNQRYLRKMTEEFFVDKENPRVEVEIRSVEDEQTV